MIHQELIRLLELDIPKRRERPGRTKFDLANDYYRPKIRTFATNNIAKFPGFGTEDLIQEISMVLWKCVDLYDPNKAAGFSTFFWTCAKRRMLDLIAITQREKRKSEFFILASPTDIDGESLTYIIDQNIEEASAEDWAMIHETVLDKWNALPYAKRLRLSDVS